MSTTISFGIKPDYFPGAPPLHLTVKLDGQTLLDQLITQAVDFTHDVAEDEASHVLEFEMLNKTHAHSPWDNNGQSLGDCSLRIESLSFDGIELDQVFSANTKYLHRRNNPAGELIVEDFHQVMGCNGLVRFEFDTPAYLWLLEKM